VLERGTRIPNAGVEVSVSPALGSPGVAGQAGQPGSPGEPLASAVTDANGRFVLGALPAGKVVVRLHGSSIGRFESPEVLTAGRARQVTYYVDRRLAGAYETVVVARRPDREVSEQRIEQEELRRIPGAQGDTLKVVENLPGVARPSFGFGALIIWGASPDDSRVYIEGIRVPVLYHFFGLRSVIAQDVVDSLTLTPGAYGAEYGRAIGGIVDVTLRDPKRDGLHGYASIDPVDVGVLLEGPLGKHTSFLIAARRAWLDATFPYLVPISTLKFTLGPRYYDYQLILRHEFTPRDILTLLVFGSDDALAFLNSDVDPSQSSKFEVATKFVRAGLQYKHRFSADTELRITPSFGYEVPVGINADFGGSPVNVNVQSYTYNLRAELRSRILAGLKLRIGVDFEGTHASADVRAPQPPREGDPSGTGGVVTPGPNPSAYFTDKGGFDYALVGPYAELSISAFDGRLEVQPGIRIDNYNLSGYRGTPDYFSRSEVQIEPRLGVRVHVTKWLALKAGVGRFYQPPQPADLSRTFGRTDLEIPTAVHYVAGLEADVVVRGLRLFDVDVQGFYKDLRMLAVRSLGSGPPLDSEGVGRAYGGQLLLRHRFSGRLFAWVAYTLSRSERRDHPGENYRPFDYDQTHILTALGSYKITRKWQVGLRYRYVTGNPSTPVVRAYYDPNDDLYRPVYGLTNSARLPDFHALDLRVDRYFIWDRFLLDLYLDVQNVTSHANPEGAIYNFNYTKTGYVTGLPILPILGLRGQF
jgi:hypothetical protein